MVSYKMEDSKDFELDFDDLSTLMSPNEMLALNDTDVMNDMMKYIDWSEAESDDWKGFLELDATGTACIRSEHSYSVLADEKSDGMSIHDGDSGGSLSDDGSLPSPGIENREMNFSEISCAEYDSADIINIKSEPCDDDDELADLHAASNGQTVPLVVLADQSTVKRHPSLLQAVAASLTSKSLSQATVIKSVQQNQTLSKLTKGAAILRQVSSLRSSGPGRRSLLTKSLATTGRGELYLTDEERRTFISEGYPIPNRLPLSRAEEQNLKRVRRKIKNKISAQESRRKKRDYVELLEKRSEIFGSENNQLRRKVEQLEAKNRSLVTQLQKFQDIIGRATRTLQSPAGTTGSCLMVLMVFFALCVGVWTPVGHHDNSWPLSSWLQQNRPALAAPLHDPYTTPNLKARTLKWVPGEDEEEGAPMSSYKDMVTSWVSGLCLPSQHRLPLYSHSSPPDDVSLYAGSESSDLLAEASDAASPAAPAVMLAERTVVAKSLGGGLVVNCTM